MEEAYTDGTLGSRILIVTEHADTGETCETLSRIIRDVVAKNGGTVEIMIASVSVHPTKFFSSDVSRKEKWVWGQEGMIGASAFRRNHLPMNDEEMNRIMKDLAERVIVAARM